MIMKNRWVTILVLAMTAIVASISTGQAANSRRVLSGPCRTPDSLTVKHLSYLRSSASSMSPDDVNWRAPAIPHITDTTGLITVVSDSAVCSRAIVSFDTLAQLGDSGVAEIEVIRVDTVFVISHPGPQPKGSEGAGRFVVDSGMRFLQGYIY